MIGAAPEGKNLKRRGLTTAPQIAVADVALGFWKALGEVGDAL
jgi:hypothetical protein